MIENTAPPIGVRMVAWLYYAASAVGTVGGVVKMIQEVRHGQFSFAIPIGVGMSSGAIAHGLQTGDVRAWRWARRLSVSTAILMWAAAALLWRYPAKATVDLPWGKEPMQPGDPRVVYFALAIGAVFAAQWITLSRRSARLYFEPELHRSDHQINRSSDQITRSRDH